MKPRCYVTGIVAVLFALGWGVAGEAPPASPQTGFTLGDALRSAVVPNMTVRRYQEYVAPGQRGSVQRSVLDFSNVKRNIQIAFVLDATNTMGRDIGGLKKHLVDFVQGIRNQVRGVSTPQQVFVEMAVVVYRDLWKNYDFEANRLVENRAEGAEILSRGERAKNGFFVFDRDLDQIVSLLGSVSLERGDPGFPEQVDRGLYIALTGLEWSPPTADDVTRIIVVAGDAPPWQEAYAAYDRCPRWWTYWEDRNDQRRPLRRHTTAELAKLAKSKGISILAIACNSGVDDPNAFQHFRNDLDEFFGRLAELTAGAFLDLSNEYTVQTLQKAVDGTTQVMLELPNISRKEIEQLRTQRDLRGVAVLPPFALNDMKFSAYEDERLDFFTAFLERLKRVEGRHIPGSRTLRQTWSNLAQQGAANESTLTTLAKALEVDFVIWGEYTPQAGASQVRLTAFGSEEGVRIDADPVSGPLDQLPEKAFTSLREAMQRSGGPKAVAFAQIYSVADSGASPPPLGKLAQASRLLEEALQFAAGTEEGRQRTNEAIASLDTVLRGDAKNPMALLLLANCQFNLNARDEAGKTLERARAACQNRPESDPTRMEIEADHALFVDKDPERAANIYERLAKGEAGRMPDSVRRALWMLAGIYLGDWDAAEKLQLDEKERRQRAHDKVVHLLVNWPDSAEAKYYQQWVPWLNPRKPDAVDPETRYADIHRVIVPAAGRTKFAQTQGAKAAGSGS